jgi:type 1 glutamine amidotransferase
MLKGIKAIALHTRMGGDVMFNPLNKDQSERLLQNGIGLTAIHWSTGADPKFGEPWLNNLGGWFNAEAKVGFSKYLVRTTKLKQIEPKHPICNGWKEYDLREEYYFKLKFLPDIKTVLSAEIDKVEYPVAWVYERPNSKGGRSFGFVGGHFHSNFGIPDFRKAVVNGILWTAHVDVPPGGAPVEITPQDMELPPDNRKKK